MANKQTSKSGASSKTSSLEFVKASDGKAMKTASARLTTIDIKKKRRIPRTKPLRTHMEYSPGRLMEMIDSYLADDTIQGNAELYQISTSGIPVKALKQRGKITSMMVEDNVIPRKTLEDAESKPDGILSPRNSEKFIRVLRLEQKAKETLGEKVATSWLKKPNKNFNGLSAMEMAKSESGARAVEQFLGRLAYGFNA